MEYCIFCENEAEYVIMNTNAPVCPACKQVYIAGQGNPEGVFDDLPEEPEEPEAEEWICSTCGFPYNPLKNRNCIECGSIGVQDL